MSLKFIPTHILGPLKHSMEDVKDEFLKYIFEINENIKPVWTILKELKESIPHFIEKYLFNIILETATNNQARIRELQRKLPNKSLLNCRNIINSVIGLIEAEGLVCKYISNLMMIVSSDEQKSDSNHAQKHQKQMIKSRLLALMLVVYQFSPEKRKSIFNIVDLWYKIYPETPICSFKDNRVGPDMIVIKPKLRQKKSQTSKVDTTQRELEWLEREFHKNLKIGCDESCIEGEDEEAEFRLGEEINLQNKLNDLSNQLEEIQIEHKNSSDSFKKNDWPSCWVEESDKMSQVFYQKSIKNHQNTFQTPVKATTNTSSSATHLLNSAPSAFNYALNSPPQIEDESSIPTPTTLLQQSVAQKPNLFPSIILRNPSHQIFNQQAQDPVSFNFFIQSQ